MQYSSQGQLEDHLYSHISIYISLFSISIMLLAYLF